MILEEIGEDPNREDPIKNTGACSKSTQYLTHGYNANPSEILKSAMFERL